MIFINGDITVTVSGDFGEVSIECFYRGSMGEDNLLKYSDTCDVTPPIIINLQPAQDSFIMNANIGYELSENLKLLVKLNL